MENKSLIKLIPNKIQVGGQDINISFVKSIEGGVLGHCVLCKGLIEIADEAYGYTQTNDSKFNTFIHECIHTILDTMGNKDLSENEEFVSTFSGFTTEIIRNIMNNKNK